MIKVIFHEAVSWLLYPRFPSTIADKSPPGNATYVL